MKNPQREQVYRIGIATADGEFSAAYSARGLLSLDFPKSGSNPQKAESLKPIPAQVQQWHQTVTKALNRALAGQEPGPLPPFDLSTGTEFQRSVWRELCRIPRGQTRSYAEVAEAIGRPKAVRAVGGACGANPIPVIVPCHRVLAANHRLGGFSGGLNWKVKLLGREGSWQPELLPS